ncbi:hypothetical protein [Marispirochaeta sp.]|uniref:hypothetical protein n=1 Tax=Marispirochaeta sp. TaxID=2038653 RepID=UPI00374811AB
MGILKNSAQDLLAMVNDLLDVSRLEQGRISLAPERRILPPLLSGLSMPYVPAVSSKG